VRILTLYGKNHAFLLVGMAEGRRDVLDVDRRCSFVFGILLQQLECHHQTPEIFFPDSVGAHALLDGTFGQSWHLKG